MEENLIIEHTTFINTSVEHVYGILTTTSGWDSWFTSGTQIDLRVGGTITLKWKDFGPFQISAEDGGQIIEVVENNLFSFQWNPGDSITTVTFTLKQCESGMIITVKETGYSNSACDIKACLDCATGWGEALTLLKFYIEHGITVK